jgi:hypothetical protein
MSTRCIDALRKLNAEIFSEDYNPRRRRKAAVLKMKRVLSDLGKALDQMDEAFR